MPPTPSQRSQFRPSFFTRTAAEPINDERQRAAPAIDSPASFALETYAVELVVAPAPTGTQGHDDVRRDAAEVQLAEDLEVTAASLVDLVRVVEAKENRARVPALRRTLELATAPAAARGGVTVGRSIPRADP